MALPDIATVSEPKGGRKEGLRVKKLASKDESRTAEATDQNAESMPLGEPYQRTASLKIPPHPSTSTFGSTSGSVWSSNRWLAECNAGLKATESKCWSQLLQSLTGEPVKWTGPKGAKGPKGPRAPNQRRLVKKAVHGILIRRPNQRVASHEDHRRFRKEASKESVSFDVEEEPEREHSIDSKTRKSSSHPSRAASAPLENEREMARASAASIESVDLVAMAEMRKRMKAILHKRVHSIRESVLRQRNETYAQKKYERLPQKEREASERAFFQYDADLSGFLEWEEVIPALRELGLSGSNAIEKREIIQVCRTVMTASQMQSLHVGGTTSLNLQEVINQHRARMQTQPRVKLGVVKKARGSRKRSTRQTSGTFGDSKETKDTNEPKRTSTRYSHVSEGSSRRSSRTSERSERSSSEESDSEDFDGADGHNPVGLASFDFLTFVGILVPKVRQRLTELQSTKVMRYFCNFDREGTGAVSVFKCLEIARCLRMEQFMMVEALQAQGFNTELGVSVDFDSFERAVMTCREQTNRQLREREVDILVEMKIPSELFEECRDDILQIYEVFRTFSGDAGSIGVVTAHDAFFSLYQLGLMPRQGWQREFVKYLLVPKDSDDSAYMNTELNFEEFLEFLRKVRQFNDEQRLEELQERFLRLDKDRNGVLDMPELHTLLEESQCSPRTRKEQEEVQQLIQSVDADGNNVIDFEEFKELVTKKKWSMLWREASLKLS